MKKNILIIGLLGAIASIVIYSSHHQAFSFFSLISPLLGSSSYGMIIMTLLLAKKIWLSSLHSFTLIAIIKLFHLPSLCAALYWVSPFYQKSMALLALVCMPLFWLHPVGYSAAVYSLFWLIPALSLFFKHDSVIAKALGSTFVAHALGSLLFIYATPYTTSYWLSLIPSVFVERTMAAVGMILMYRVYYAVISHLSKACSFLMNKMLKTLLSERLI